MGTTEIVLVTNAGAYARGSIDVVDYDGDKGSPQSGAAASSTPGAAVTAANMTTSGTGIVLSTSTAGNIISINTNITPTSVTGTAAKTGT
jgi:hypothetical protein